jgi:hypothetical protein
MRDRHESGERWSSKNGVVLRRPIDDLELDLLLPKVRRGAENDI